MTKKTLSSREQNRADRHERRDEIIDRWKSRIAIDMFVRRTDEPQSGHDLLMRLMACAEWAYVGDLVVALDPRKHTSLLIAALRVIQLKEMPYQEYLQTDEWRERAQRCKNRYNNECAFDASHPAEHAHHRTYERRGREYLDDLIPLCAACHAKHHDRRP